MMLPLVGAAVVAAITVWVLPGLSYSPEAAPARAIRQQVASTRVAHAETAGGLVLSATPAKGSTKSIRHPKCRTGGVLLLVQARRRVRDQRDLRGQVLLARTGVTVDTAGPGLPMAVSAVNPTVPCPGAGGRAEQVIGQVTCPAAARPVSSPVQGPRRWSRARVQLARARASFVVVEEWVRQNVMVVVSQHLMGSHLHQVTGRATSRAGGSRTWMRTKT